MKANASAVELWPALPWEEWKQTATTLHMRMQIVGKTGLALTPRENHWWNVPLYVTPRGLSTWSMPYHDDLFDIEFDFVEHRSWPKRDRLALPGSDPNMQLMSSDRRRSRYSP